MSEHPSRDSLSSRTLRGVVFRSPTRSQQFLDKLISKGVQCTMLDFAEPAWIEFDYSKIDIIVYYPSFMYSSNHPLALLEVADNLQLIAKLHSHIQFYPDPTLFRYYNDKYRQFLFLKSNEYPIPRTIPLYSQAALDLAEQHLGYPMVLKNRFGAGGGYVFRVERRKELQQFYRLSTLDLFSIHSVGYFVGEGLKRLSLYQLIKARRARYPFLSPPLLAQEFVPIDRDLKTVCRDAHVIEGHWRLPARPGEWKTNIDGGGAGVWSHIPEEALELSRLLARDLNARWLNIDLLFSDGRFLISEFSPVWHHYAYLEKENFRYCEDYNAEMTLKEALDLEEIISNHLIERAHGSTMSWA